MEGVDIHPQIAIVVTVVVGDEEYLGALSIVVCSKCDAYFTIEHFINE